MVESFTLFASLNVFEHSFRQSDPLFEVLYLSEEICAVYSQLWFRSTVVVLQEDKKMCRNYRKKLRASGMLAMGLQHYKVW